MARGRKYGWNGEMPEKAVSGQAQIVLNGLKALPDEMHTGHEWAELIGKDLATRQDPYRVVLYYILILKSRGCIRTEEFEIDAVTKNGEVKHRVTVRSNASVDEREILPETVPSTDGPEDDDEEDIDEETADELVDQLDN